MALPCPDPEHIHKAMGIRKLAKRFAFLTSWPIHLAIAVAFTSIFLVALAEPILIPKGAPPFDSGLVAILWLVFPHAVDFREMVDQESHPFRNGANGRKTPPFCH